MRALCLPVVEDLWDLPSGLVGAIATQAAGTEGEGDTIGALHRGHASITVSRPAAVVPQSDSVLHPLLQQKKLISEIICILMKKGKKGNTLYDAND